MLSIYKLAKEDANKITAESEISPGIKLYIFRTWILLILWFVYKVENYYNNLKRVEI